MHPRTTSCFVFVSQAILEAALKANAGAEVPMVKADVEILVAVERAVESRRAECRCCSRARLIHE
jgi:hypothetical protein